MSVSSIISRDILEKCNYFNSFPTYFTAAIPLKEANIRKVIDEKDICKESLKIGSHQFLTPAVCLHVYPMFEGKEINEDKIITVISKAFRNEKSYEKGIRLWEYTLREIIFIGSEKFVKENILKVRNKTLSFAKTINSEAEIVSATDNFYPTDINNIKSRIQKVNNHKSEISVKIRGKNIAIASFNYHDTHFSDAFCFSKNSTIVTGCIGFGLERWIEACKEYSYKITES